MKDEEEKSKARLSSLHPSPCDLHPFTYCSASTRRKPRCWSRVERATQLRTVAVIGLSPSGRPSNEPPRITNHPCSPWPSFTRSLPLYNEASVLVTSQRLPIMSATPCGVLPW